MERIIFFLTFDVDLTDYLSGRELDELDQIFPSIRQLLDKYSELKTTWFIRIDKQIEALYGKPDFIFKKHNDKIQWLRSNGHEIGWHYHAYQYRNNKWEQCLDDKLICDELEKFSSYAKEYKLHITRMGWGYHSAKTIQKIYDLGFVIDSSAIARPFYPWEKTYKDWTGTPNKPYYPSVKDYRVPGEKRIGILEVPITTAIVKTDSDTQDVRRYINIAYKHTAFMQAIETLESYSSIVSITHPYELFANAEAHSLLSFNMIDIDLNIQYLIKKGFKFENDFNKLLKDADS